MSKPYQVFCSAKLQWNGRKLEPFKRSRSQGIAESECRRLMRENPEAVAVALGPNGFKYSPEEVNYKNIRRAVDEFLMSSPPSFLRAPGER
jgi:hypothetical protein